MFAVGELAMTAHDLALWNESLMANPSQARKLQTDVHRGKAQERQGHPLWPRRRSSRPQRPSRHRAQRRSLRFCLRQRSARRRRRSGRGPHQSGCHRRCFHHRAPRSSCRLANSLQPPPKNKPSTSTATCSKARSIAASSRLISATTSPPKPSPIFTPALHPLANRSPSARRANICAAA